MITETVTLLRAGVTSQDDYGNDVLTEEEIPVPGAVIWPRDGNASGGNESTQAQDLVIAGLTALLPTGTVVTPTDRVSVRGVTYEVDGSTWDWQSPFTGTRPGVQAALRRVTG